MATFSSETELMPSKTATNTLANSTSTDNGKLGGLLGADITAATISASLISPIIVAMDRSVVESVATGRSLRKTFQKHAWNTIAQPRGVIGRPLLVVWTLYAATYSMANVTHTVAPRVLGTVDRAVLGGIVSLNTFLINTPLSVWKDVRFAQFFSSGGANSHASGTSITQRAAGPVATASLLSSSTSPKSPPAPARASVVPSRIGSSGLAPPKVCAAFLIRDMITVFGTFALAPQVAVLIPDSEWTRTPEHKETVSQLVVPALTQIFATPLHLLALDMHARPAVSSGQDVERMTKRRITITDRYRLILDKWPSTTLMRGLRLIPAFGFGVVCNTRLRSYFHGAIDADDSAE